VTFALYLDEDSEGHALLRALRKAGVDVTSAGEGQMRGKRDAEHLAWSTEHGRVLYTGNRGDFVRLHTQTVITGRTHAGIVVFHRARYSVGEQVRRIERLQTAFEQDDFTNRLEWLAAWGE
jgi:hypothetical protein